MLPCSNFISLMNNNYIGLIIIGKVRRTILNELVVRYFVIRLLVDFKLYEIIRISIHSNRTLNSSATHSMKFIKYNIAILSNHSSATFVLSTRKQAAIKLNGTARCLFEERKTKHHYPLQHSPSIWLGYNQNLSTSVRQIALKSLTSLSTNPKSLSYCIL